MTTKLQEGGADKQYSFRSLRLILRELSLPKRFKYFISDPRSGPTKYSISSLLMSGLLIPLLRRRSRNAFHEPLDNFFNFQQNVQRIIEASETPSPKTIEDLFLQLKHDEVAEILPDILSQLIKRKFFCLHPECVPDNEFIFTVDATAVHCYHKDSQHPTPLCKYCLERTRDSTSWFLHIDVYLCLVTPWFTLPLFIHRVRRQGRLLESHSISQEKFKQECEFTALPILLESFRKHFPKLKCRLLLDSLYANGTTMEICEKYAMNYTVVKKEDCLSSITEDAMGLKQLERPQEHTLKTRRWTSHRQAYLLPNLTHKTHSLALIELFEKSQLNPSKRIARVTEKTYHWQWITNTPPRYANLMKFIDQARLRWKHEDMNNALKNRGFEAKHDMSRAPDSQIIWRYMMAIAFALSSLLQITQLDYHLRNRYSLRNWIDNIFSELLQQTAALLWPSDLPKQWRFYLEAQEAVPPF